MKLQRVIPPVLFLLCFGLGCYFLSQSNLSSLNSQSFTDKTDFNSDSNSNLNSDSVSDSDSDSDSDEMTKFYRAVQTDFQKLRASSKQQAFNVFEVIWHIHDSNIKVANLSQAVGYSISSNSGVMVEAEVFSQENETKENTSTVIQISYFDKKTKNKIFELSRMYEYKTMFKKDKKKPD